MKTGVGKVCPYCERDTAPSDYVSLCFACGAVMHERCWITNGKCTSLGCTGRAGRVVRASTLVSRGVVAVPSNGDKTAIGKTCPFCQSPSKPDVDLIECPECGIPHHEGCWQQNGGCTTFGCRGRADADARTEARAVSSAAVPTAAPTSKLGLLMGNMVVFCIVLVLMAGTGCGICSESGTGAGPIGGSVGLAAGVVITRLGWSGA